MLQILLALVLTLAVFQAPDAPPPPKAPMKLDAPMKLEAPSTYSLGPDDQILITALDLDEVTTKVPIRIDSRGFLNLPLVGRIKASGLTPDQLEDEIKKRLEKVLHEPQVTVSLVEMRSQPISILGAVQTPGVHQIQGRKTLYEVISIAGGIRNDAGYQIKVTRRLEWGRLPLPNAQDDPSGKFSIASVSVKSVMEAANPVENIDIRPQDVISVPKGEVVYAVGAVKKSGGFVLGERERISALQVLSLAEGLDRFADTKNAKIMRAIAKSDQREEIGLNLQAMLKGKAPDVSMQADDIMFVPTSGKKAATVRGAEAAIQIGTGLVIFRR